MMERDINTITRKARLKALGGDFATGHELLDEAELLACGNPAHIAMCQLERGRLFNSAGKPEQAVAYFQRAWELACGAQAHGLAVDAAHMLAIACPLPAASEWTTTALDYIGAHPTEAYWRGPLHNNLGWTYFEAGRYDEAMVVFEEALAVYAALGNPANIRIARYAITRTMRAQGRIGDAIALGEQAVAEADAHGENAPYLYEELAALHHEIGQRETSRDYACRALTILHRDASFVSGEPSRFARLLELAGEPLEMMR
jgi:tetratricopeptide (TPR) repeat protein